jgi:transposase
VKQSKVPWARKGSGFTLLMDSLIVLMAQHMTVTAIAEMIDEHDTRIWRVVEHYVAEARSNEDFSTVRSVGVDETSRAKGHKNVSVFIDLEESRVIHVCGGKDASTIKSFKDDLEQHNGSSKGITNFCCDMSPAFISGIRNSFPNASITFDKFHVMKLMNDAVDRVRREEQSRNALLKKTRYVWLKNPENLTAKQKEILIPLNDLRLKTIKAYNIKLALRDFWNYKYRKSGETYLKRWYYWATHSRINPVIDCAKTIKQHWDGINNYIKTKIDNGILEGTNSMIQAAKDNARGFRSTKNFITTIYLRMGKLKFNLPT